ncbi:hypothetical protein D3C80_1951600 [compost metagenome]
MGGLVNVATAQQALLGGTESNLVTCQRLLHDLLSNGLQFIRQAQALVFLTYDVKWHAMTHTQFTHQA